MPKSSTPKKLTVDFTGVEVRRGGASGARVPEGDYLLRVVGCERKAKKDDDTSFYLNWRTEIVKPAAHAGKTIYHRTSLRQEALWSLRTFLVDLLGEANVPASSVDIPIAKIVEKKPLIGATLQDGDPYNDKIKSEIAATFPKKEYSETEEEDEDEEEEEEAPKAKKKKAEEPAKKSKKKVEEEEDEDDEDLDELDTDDL